MSSKKKPFLVLSDGLIIYKIEECSNKEENLTLFDMVISKEFEVNAFKRRLKVNVTLLNMIVDTDENTLLHCACKVGNVKAVEVLLNFGAVYLTFNKNYNTCIHICVYNKQNDCLNLILIKAKKDEIFTKLEYSELLSNIANFNTSHSNTP